MMCALYQILLGCLCLQFALNAAVNTDLEIVSDDELLNLIRTEHYVVVLFTKKKCDSPDCEKFETELINAREELVDNLSAWVVKAVNSPLYRLYSTSEPCILFFRMGVPLLYDGPINDEHIAHRFTENKEPVVKELTDDNFEHLTQASTGATTGDWFVMFYSTDCVECQRLGARWEAVGAELKTRMNVARINRQTQAGQDVPLRHTPVRRCLFCSICEGTISQLSLGKDSTRQNTVR
uniref:Thioredoxin domain-containing protein n=1 Tax=Cacopsylla melanoneura TaxID=428564 RepID=A0A8D8UQY4_9HEMI